MTSVWQGQLNISRLADVVKVVVSHRSGIELREAAITVALYARSRDQWYIAAAWSVRHAFDLFGSCVMDDFISMDQLLADNSPYVIDGSLYIRVFVRPISFHFPQLQ